MTCRTRITGKACLSPIKYCKIVKKVLRRSVLSKALAKTRKKVYYIRCIDNFIILSLILKIHIQTIKQEEVSMNFDYDASLDSGAKIKVIGVGGAGNNAVNRMVSEDVKGVDFVAVQYR